MCTSCRSSADLLCSQIFSLCPSRTHRHDTQPCYRPHRPHCSFCTIHNFRILGNPCHHSRAPNVTNTNKSNHITVLAALSHLQTPFPQPLTCPPFDPTGSSMLPPAKDFILFHVYNDFFDYQIALLETFRRKTGCESRHLRIIPFMPH